MSRLLAVGRPAQLTDQLDTVSNRTNPHFQSWQSPHDGGALRVCKPAAWSFRLVVVESFIETVSASSTLLEGVTDVGSIDTARQLGNLVGT